MVTLLYSAGLRMGEVCRLRYEDISRSRMRIFILFIYLFKMLLDNLTVTVVVLVILILCYDRTLLSDGFLKVGSISPMLFSCFAPECGFRVRWILHHG